MYNNTAVTGMNIRLRAILVIISTNVVIILFSVLVGIYYVEKNIDISMEVDLAVMANIAERFVSQEIYNLKLKARLETEALELAAGSDLPEFFRERLKQTPEFIGMTILDSSGNLLVSAGESPGLNIINNEYIRPVFLAAAKDREDGDDSTKIAISSTVQTINGVVFYLAVSSPITHNRVFIITIRGNYFKERLSPFIIWETGHIYMSDSQGYAISNPRENWLQNRFNYIDAAKIDPTFKELAATVTRMTKGETGTGHYTVYGEPRVSSFRPIAGSEEGWSICVVAPLKESPVRDIDMGLMVVALVSILLNVVFAFIASGFIKKPFDRIEVLKVEAENANKAKSLFLSTVSHEIRTPMNAILGISEIQLQNEKLDPAIRDALEKIYSSGDLLLSIINDILDLSKIEAAKLELLPAKYEIASLVSDAAQLNMMRIGSKPIEFELDVNENMPSQMIGDELRIKQILNNLLSNAFKYTSKGYVKLYINAEESEKQDEVKLLIVVSDTGHGMTDKQLEKLFDEYTRFNEDRNRATEGTGLGMNITRKLIQIMGGDIKVDSVPNEGSVFTVRLHQGKCECERIGKEVTENLRRFRTQSRSFMTRVQISREPMPYGKVLVVDDVEANIYVATGLLAPYQLNLSTVSSGFDAIDKIKDGEMYDLIFMDHMMPDMDGIETTRRIRDMGYKAPIVALTANAVSGQAEVFLKNGFDDFISKPIDIRQLNAILNKFVRDKQSKEVLESARMNINQKDNDSEISHTGYLIPLLLSRKIKGLDIVKGLKRFEGDAEFYLRVLNAYAISINAAFNVIQNVNSGNLNEYKIKVHGIKGTSYDIAASEIAQEAELLEKAATSGDIDFIMEHNPAFSNTVQKIVMDIEEMLSSLEAENPKPKKDKPEEELLLKLLAACKKYNMDKADEAMMEIEQFQYVADDGLVAWLRRNIDIVNFEEAAEKLNGLLNKGE